MRKENHLGCYKDLNDRDLDYVFDNNQTFLVSLVLNPPMCMKKCYELNQMYAGLQFG